MGGGQSERNLEKSIDAAGNVNNNVIVDNEVPIVSKEIVTFLAALFILQLIQLCLYVYSQYTRKLKKRYSNTTPKV